MAICESVDGVKVALTRQYSGTTVAA
jgi:hypothetical protein